MPGGIIPPDGRQPAPKGTGKQARRHDLEKPKTPGLAGSSLQYGDVSMLNDAQKIAPTGSNTKQIQQPASGTTAGGQAATPRQAAGPSQMSVPDPVDFLSQRAGGTLAGGGGTLPQRRVDVSGWTPIVAAVANAPQASGLLRQAFLHQFSALARRPYVPDVMMVYLQAMDAGVEAHLAE